MTLPRTFLAATAISALLAGCSMGGGGGDAATEAGGGAATETAGDGAASAGAASVSVVDNAFEPSTVEVAAGDTVSWTHDGEVTHTVTFEDGEDSGDLEPGDTFDRTFSEAGEYPYVCTIHASMEGTVTVTG